MIRSVAKLFKGRPNSGKVRILLELKSSCVTRIDESAIKQVLMNLLINASEAMNNAGKIKITLAKKSGFIKISVIDEGPGITAGQAEKIFSPFFTTKAKGTGLGLSISRDLIEQHGGNINTVVKKQGAVFEINLPEAGNGK